MQPRFLPRPGLERAADDGRMMSYADIREFFPRSAACGAVLQDAAAHEVDMLAQHVKLLGDRSGHSAGDDALLDLVQPLEKIGALLSCRMPERHALECHQLAIAPVDPGVDAPLVEPGDDFRAGN